jgi:hypothetical protein
LFSVGIEPSPQTTTSDLQANTLAAELVIQLQKFCSESIQIGQLWQILVIGIISNVDFICFYMYESIFKENKETCVAARKRKEIGSRIVVSPRKNIRKNVIILMC